MTVLKFLCAIATPEFVAPVDAIRTVPGPIAKRLLAMRQPDPRGDGDGAGLPIVEIVSNPQLMARAKPLFMCKDAEPTWTAEDSDNE